jgi:hypothetical protein
VEAADAKILQQYRATGIAYTEAVYDPSAWSSFSRRFQSLSLPNYLYCTILPAYDTT